MKIYTLIYDFNHPNQMTITVQTNTDYLIGVSAMKDGQLLDLTLEDVSMKIGENTYTPTTIINGYVVFPYSQGRTPASELAKMIIKGTSFDMLIAGKYSTKGSVSEVASGTSKKFEVEYEDGTTEEFDVIVK